MIVLAERQWTCGLKQAFVMAGMKEVEGLKKADVALHASAMSACNFH